MTNNQKIIFDIPGEETAPDVISNILENNGVSGITEELVSPKGTPRLIIVTIAVKDFFDKKITEEKFTQVFQEQLKIPRENTIKIINELKEKILPFAKKINIEQNNKSEKTVEQPNEKIQRPIKSAAEIKKPETKKISKPGQDSYREPIE